MSRLDHAHRALHRTALKTLLAETKTKAARNDAMAQAYIEHGYTLAEISRQVGLHYARISRIIKSVEKRS